MIGGGSYGCPVRAHCCDIGGDGIASDVNIVLCDHVGTTAREQIILRAKHILQFCGVCAVRNKYQPLSLRILLAETLYGQSSESQCGERELLTVMSISVVKVHQASQQVRL